MVHYFAGTSNALIQYTLLEAKHQLLYQPDKDLIVFFTLNAVSLSLSLSLSTSLSLSLSPSFSIYKLLFMT